MSQTNVGVVTVSLIEWYELCESRLLQSLKKSDLIRYYLDGSTYIIEPEVTKIPRILSEAATTTLTQLEIKLMTAFKIIYQEHNNAN